MRKHLVLSCSLLLIMQGCMTGRVQPAAECASAPGRSILLVEKIEYDEHGRPLFNDVLKKRPSHAQDRFTIVQFSGGRPVVSYDIAIVGEEQIDLKKPLSVIYEWTGKGFEAGFQISGHMMGAEIHASGRDAAVYLTIMTAPIIIGGVTGFVIGIAESIPDTAAELRKVIVNKREKVTAYTNYEYDEEGRMRSMNLYPPGEHIEALVRTRFMYAGKCRDPYKTEIMSVPENKTRVLQ
jgi:hypothetical protein